MRILLTNDDGFEAPGIRALYDVLSREHEVWMVAPEFNKSGASASINLTSKSILKNHGGDIYSLAGTPVDCVMATYKGAFIPLPDLIISGINNGGNMGTDVVYSGTCSAARQGALYDIPSVALSLEKDDWNDPSPYCFNEMAEFVLKNIEIVYKIACSETKEKYVDYETGKEYKVMYFLNINAPSRKSYKGVKWASLAKKNYNDRFDLVEIEGGYETCLHFGPDVAKHGDEDMDCRLVSEGYVVLSLIKCIPDAFRCSDLELEKQFKL